MTQKHEALFLSVEDVVQAGGADMALAIQDLEQGFYAYEAGKVSQPPKTSIGGFTGSSDNFVNIMPSHAHMGGEEIFGCKIIGSNPENSRNGTPRAVGFIALLDSDSKLPIAIMDAQVISAIRTGAASALATRVLTAATESVGLIGAGINMRTQLLGVMEELPSLERVVVHTRNGSKKVFADEMSKRTGLEIIPKETAEEVIKGNSFNILCTTKPSSPIIEDDWVSRGGSTLFNISGLATPVETVSRMDRMVSDSWVDCSHRDTQSLSRAEKLGMVDPARIENLGTILMDGVGRKNAQEDIFFCPVGLAFEDIVVAERVYRNAKELGIGQSLRFWDNPKWI